jgi:hypothetical protein
MLPYLKLNWTDQSIVFFAALVQPVYKQNRPRGPTPLIPSGSSIED